MELTQRKDWEPERVATVGGLHRRAWMQLYLKVPGLLIVSSHTLPFLSYTILHWISHYLEPKKISAAKINAILSILCFIPSFFFNPVWPSKFQILLFLCVFPSTQIFSSLLAMLSCFFRIIMDESGTGVIKQHPNEDIDIPDGSRGKEPACQCRR